MFELIRIFAEEEAAQPKGMTFEPLLIMLALFGLFYFLVIRPMKRREVDERQNMLSSMKKNDKVMTTAGIYGTIVSVSDKEDEVVVKVDDNCRLKMSKASILKNLTAEETAKAAKEQKDAQKKETSTAITANKP